MSLSAKAFWSIVALNIKTMWFHKIRVIMLLVLIALISVTAGILGNFFLNNDNIIGTVSVAVVDLDDGFETRMILSYITESAGYGELLNVVVHNETSAAVALENGDVTAIVTFPQNFGTALVTGENIPFNVTYNENRPLTSALVRVMANAFSDMLKSSQMGVYVTLNYARQQNLPAQQFDRMFLGVNMRFIGLVMSRSDIFFAEDLTFDGLLIWQSYSLAFYIALMMCAGFVMTDVKRRNFNNFTLINLRQQGIGGLHVNLACIFSFFLLFIVLNIGLWLFLVPYGMPIKLIPVVIVIGMVLSSFSTMLIFVFKSTVSAGGFTALFVGISLFLSGGIIPVAYFGRVFQVGSFLVFNTWGTRLFAAVLTEESVLLPLVMCFIFATIFMSIGHIAAHVKGGASS